MKALVTGITGFSGGWLCRELLSDGNYEVAGIARNLKKASNRLSRSVKLYQGDMLDKTSLIRAIRDFRPDCIFHLAGQSNVDASWKKPSETLQVNVLGQANLFEALVEENCSPRVLSVSSSHIYGNVPPEEMPLNEKKPYRPGSPYAASKASQDMMALCAFRWWELPVIVVRPFNHIGPGQKGTFIFPGVASQIADAEAGLIPPDVFVGNIDVENDITDVRDIARGYRMLLEQGQAGEAYQLCSGKPRRLESLLKVMIGYSKVKIRLCQDPTRIRPADIKLVYGDNRKLKEAAAWEPTHEIEDTLLEILEEWRGKDRF